MATDLASLLNELRRGGIRDRRVLAAIAEVPRERFVPSTLLEEAYSDEALPIGCGQTISQPFIVGLMSQALELQGDERVLEVGTGSGYQAAVLAHLCREVYTVEIIPALATQARERLEDLGLANVSFRIGDGTRGWPEEAPFDGILVTAAPSFIPPVLLQQLRSGSLILPVGPTGTQQLLKIAKRPGNPVSVTELIPVRFVPMTGAAAS